MRAEPQPGEKHYHRCPWLFRRCPHTPLPHNDSLLKDRLRELRTQQVSSPLAQGLRESADLHVSPASVRARPRRPPGLGGKDAGRKWGLATLSTGHRLIKPEPSLPFTNTSSFFSRGVIKQLPKPDARISTS